MSGDFDEFLEPLPRPRPEEVVSWVLVALLIAAIIVACY